MRRQSANLLVYGSAFTVGFVLACGSASVSELVEKVLARKRIHAGTESHAGTTEAVSTPSSTMRRHLQELVSEPDIKKRAESIRPLVERAFRRSPAEALKLAGEIQAAWPEPGLKACSSLWQILHAISRAGDGGLGALTASAEWSDCAQRGKLPDSANQPESQAAPMNSSGAFETNPKRWLSDMLALKNAAGLSALQVISFMDEAHRAFASAITDADMLAVAKGPYDDERMALVSLSYYLEPAKITNYLRAISTAEVTGVNSTLIKASSRRLAAAAPGEALQVMRTPGLNADARRALLEALADSAPSGYSPSQEDFADLTPKERALLSCAALRGNGATGEQAESLATAALSACAALGSEGTAVAKQVQHYFLEIQNQPEAALRAGVAMQPGEARDGYLSEMVARWAAVDVVGASASLAAAPQGTVPDAAIASLISEIHGDPDATFAWALRIQDTARRSELIAAELKKLAKSDAAGAAQWAEILRNTEGQPH